MSEITLSVGSTIQKRGTDETFVIRSIGHMVTYSGEDGDGEVAIQHFDSEFTVVQPEVTIHAYITRIDCPFCEEPLTGFVGDPRGENIDCESCHRTFFVPNESTIVL